MKFKNEYDYLIHLLYCALNNIRPEEIPEQLSLEKVLTYGITHEVANIAYLSVKKLKNPVDSELMTKWKEIYLHAVKRDLNQAKIRCEILDALHEHGIYTLEVQGTAVKNYYPLQHLRMMSDLDFIVPVERYGEISEIVSSAGFYTTVLDEKKEIHAEKNGLLVELHTEFFSDDRDAHEVLNHPFSCAALNDDYSASVTDTTFYLFHLLHTIKHAVEYMGVGIRRIIDLYYLEDAMKGKADFDYIDGVLKKYGFYDVKERLIAVKDHWFRNIEPKKTDSEFEAFENEILESGNHGTEELLYKNKFKREREKGKKFVKTKYFLGQIFLRKEACYKAFPFCEKHRYPILLCWIHRFNCIVFNPKRWKKVAHDFTTVKKS